MLVGVLLNISYGDGEEGPGCGIWLGGYIKVLQRCIVMLGAEVWDLGDGGGWLIEALMCFGRAGSCRPCSLYISKLGRQYFEVL